MSEIQDEAWMRSNEIRAKHFVYKVPVTIWAWEGRVKTIWVTSREAEIIRRQIDWTREAVKDKLNRFDP
jgi:SRSO17 transposase